MKIHQFLKEVDEHTNQMSREELKRFIHEVARILPEGNRESFLETLENAKDELQTEKREFAQEDGNQGISARVRKIVDRLERIHRGTKRLEGKYNEGWNDWYGSEEDEVQFSDPEKLLPDISEAMELVHQCTDAELYEDGCKLSDVLCNLEVHVDGDYDYDDYDGEPLDIDGLYEKNLLEGDLENCLKECLYLIYMGNELSNRPEKLYGVFQKFRRCDIKVENILQMGNRELPDFDEFLNLWTDFLGKERGKVAEKLMKEAQTMLWDDSAALENARKYVNEHPSLYLQLLEMKKESGKESEMLKIGLEALDRIPKNLAVRSEVALSTADYAERLGEFDIRESCWIEALRSHTTVLNYMRVKFLSRDPSKYGDEIGDIITEAYEKTDMKDGCGMEAEKENRVDKNDFCIMMFFERQFEKMEQIGMNVTGSLGWSLSFMKEGISLLLLMLYKGKFYPRGMEAMTVRAISACSFDAKKLYREMDNEKNDTDAFLHILEQWKETVRITEEEKNSWLEKIDSWIKRRVQGIMEANRRNYYEECASFIASYGEVLESYGDLGAKFRVMEHYRQEYPRRRSFHEALRRFGMV